MAQFFPALAHTDTMGFFDEITDSSFLFLFSQEYKHRTKSIIPHFITFIKD